VVSRSSAELPRPKRKIRHPSRYNEYISSDSDALIQGLLAPHDDELEIPTPRATASGTNRGTGNVTRIRSSQSSGGAMTDVRCVQEERVRFLNSYESTIFDVSFE
jgi:hypothetical protein